MGFFTDQTKPARSPVLAEPENEQEAPPVQPEGTVIAQGMTLTGRLSGSGPVRIEGTLEGELALFGDVTITGTGKVNGPVEADSVYVAGLIQGDVLAREHLRLEMTGTVDGNVKTASFVIEDGGCLNGRCTMTKKGKEPTFLY